MFFWQELEKKFNRAIRHTFVLDKMAIVFPVLALCGLLSVICRTLSYGAGEWITMSLSFLPIFLCGGLLFAAGIVVIRLYHHEIKGRKLKILKTIKSSSRLFWGISFLTVPLIFTYLILWMILGLFYLLRAIPGIGEVISSILSFGPFLLVLGSLALSFLTLLTLFYLTPAVSLKSQFTPEFTATVFRDLKKNPFLAVVFPLVALFPLLLTTAFLSLSALVTQIMYVGSGHVLSIFLKWLFMMVPFSALLTPPVIFFFQFAAESYVLMRKLPQEQ